MLSVPPFLSFWELESELPEQGLGLIILTFSPILIPLLQCSGRALLRA
jgi:hypothetical protein